MANTPADFYPFIPPGLVPGALALAQGHQLVTTFQGTSSTSYTDLATVGAQVTLTTGTSAIVIYTCNVLRNAGTGNTAYVSIGVSGASSNPAADDARSTSYASAGSGFAEVLLGTYKFTGLTAGSNTFTMKYRCDGGGPWNFFNRSLIVIAI